MTGAKTGRLGPMTAIDAGVDVSAAPAMKYDPYPSDPTFADLEETHRLVVEEIPPGSRVLELGCATGYLGKVLTREKRCRVVGIEIDSEAITRCEDTYERALVGNLNDPASVDWESLGDFDAVMASAVLEHLVAPDAILQLAAARVRPGGVVVVNLPNIAHWTIRNSLLRGRWDYTDYGILDRTHLRFFTIQTARELFESSGLEIERFSFTYGPRPLPLKAASLFLGGRRFRDAVCDRCPGLFGQEMVIRARAPA
jgi:methionine biosynthesis protein MetW